MNRALALFCLIFLPALAEAQIVSPPPSEGATGSANSEIRSDIISGQGCTTVTILGVDLEKCPAVPFGSYSSNASRGESVAGGPGGSTPGGNGPGNGSPGGGGRDPGNGGNDPSGPSDGGSDRPGGDRGGRPDRGEPNCER